MSYDPQNTHLLDVPRGMRRRIGNTAVVELPECMGRDVKLTILRDRLYAFSPNSNVVVILPSSSPELPADCG